MSICKYGLSVITDAVASGSMPETRLLSKSGFINMLIACKWMQKSCYDRTAGLIFLLNSCDIEEIEIFSQVLPTKKQSVADFLDLLGSFGMSITHKTSWY